VDSYVHRKFSSSSWCRCHVFMLKHRKIVFSLVMFGEALPTG
jgi:hypothetical protein